jgi:hypothetical protein
MSRKAHSSRMQPDVWRQKKYAMKGDPCFKLYKTYVLQPKQSNGFSSHKKWKTRICLLYIAISVVLSTYTSATHRLLKNLFIEQLYSFWYTTSIVLKHISLICLLYIAISVVLSTKPTGLETYSYPTLTLPHKIHTLLKSFLEALGSLYRGGCRNHF